MSFAVSLAHSSLKRFVDGGGIRLARNGKGMKVLPNFINTPSSPPANLNYQLIKTNMEKCEACGSEIKTIPAGTSKRTGKPYNAFQACSNRDCTWKPKQGYSAPQTPTRSQDISHAQDRKGESIKVSSTMRDAVLLTTSKGTSELSEQDIQALILFWRKWLWNRWDEKPDPDEAPF